MGIVALYGAGNHGKTETLNSLIDSILASGGTARSIRNSDFSANDRLACLDYKGKTVCIATGGDDSRFINEAWAFKLPYNPDVEFYATRTKETSSSVSALMSLSGGMSIEWWKPFWVRNIAFAPNANTALAEILKLTI